MSRVVKVFVPPGRQDEVAGSDHVIEHYDAFAVLEVSEARAEALAQKYMVEDITDQYAIPVGDALEQEIDPTVPRVTASGRVASHPAYRGARSSILVRTTISYSSSGRSRHNGWLQSAIAAQGSSTTTSASR